MFSSLYDQFTNSIPKADRAHAALTGVGAGKFAKLRDECWVCTVFEAGMPAASGCRLIEEHVFVDAMRRKHDSTTV